MGGQKLIFLFSIICAFGPPVRGQVHLDPTTFVVVGGGWAAGYGDFQLAEDLQRAAFPLLMARQMDTILPSPLLDPGENSGVLVSFDPLPDLLPRQAQATVRSVPFSLFSFNLSVPFIRVSDSLNRLPVPVPANKLVLVDQDDLRQSMVNLVLGYPLLVPDKPASWTQVEYAENMAPTFVLVQLGFGDVLEGALTGQPSLITPAGQFLSGYDSVVKKLTGTNASVLLLTVPDPMDTAYFSTLEQVAEYYETEASALQERFGLDLSDSLTLGGLVEIGEQLSGNRPPGELSSRSILKGSDVEAIRQTVALYNQGISEIAGSYGAAVFDLGGFVREVRDSGIPVGHSRIGGAYLEGFYSSDGLFPGVAGHAVLAGVLLDFVNRTYGTDFPQVDLLEIAEREGLAR